MLRSSLAKAKSRARHIVRTRLFPEPPESERRQALIDGFVEFHGRQPDLDAPTRFSDKLLARLLDPPDPIYPLIGYKHLVPAFVHSRVGDRLAFARKYRVVRRLEPQHFEGLPSAYVVKSSYGAGLNEIVTDASKLDVPRLCARFNERMPQRENARKERGADNCAIIEEYLNQPGRLAPDDIKIFCFHSRSGKFRYLLQYATDRFVNYRRSYFDEDGNWLPFTEANRPRHEERPELPGNVDELVNLAKDLSRGFDFMRVDLYSIEGVAYFGELTPHHMAGMFKFDDPDADERIGRLWERTVPMFTWNV